MAEYYADISNSYTSTGDGTPGNPWNYYQTLYEILLAGGDTIYLRGKRESTSSLWFPKTNAWTGPVYCKAWNKELYGPYVYQAPSGSVGVFKYYSNSQFITEDAIIIADTISYYVGSSYKSPYIHMRNCIFYGDFSYVRDSSEQTTDVFAGCTFVNGNFIISDYNPGNISGIDLIFSYCLMYNYSFIEPTDILYKNEGNITFRSCITNLSESDLFGGLSLITHSGQESVYSASPSTFPNYTELTIGETVNSGVLFYQDYNLPIPHPTGFSAREEWNDTYYIARGLNNVSRAGYGAFYFRPDFYVDLTLTGINNFIGTTTKPFTKDEFERWIDNTVGGYELCGSGDILNIKGTISCTGNYRILPTAYHFNSSATLKAWDKSLFGPWGIECSGRLYIGGTVTGPYIYLYDSLLKASGIELKTQLKAYGSYIASDAAFNIIGGTSQSYYGCTINTGPGGVSWVTAPYNGILTFKDCVFPGPTVFANAAPVSFSTFNFDYCTFEAEDSGLITSGSGPYYSGGTFNFSSCEWGWDAPDWIYWPSISGSTKNDWKYSVLGSGITNSGSLTWSE